MSGTKCPTCGGVIVEDDINIKEGVGLCRACDKLWRLGELAEGSVAYDGPFAKVVNKLVSTSGDEVITDAEMPAAVPSGCWLSDSGTQIVVGAKCRSASGFFFLIFATFWNSIVSVFVLIAAGGLYTNLIGTLPSWFPMAGNSSGGKHGGMTASTMPLGMTLFLCVFLIPFVLVGAGTAAAALVGLFGKVEVRLNGREGVAFTGVGAIGWKRAFEADLVRNVKIGDAGSSTNNKPDRTVIIEANRRIKIGTMLSEERQRWFAGALRKILVAKK